MKRQLFLRYRAKRGNIVVETEGRPDEEIEGENNKDFTNIHLENLENGSVATSAVCEDLVQKETSDDPEENRKSMVNFN